MQTGMPLDQALVVFLLHYRVTPHSTTGVAPCTLFCGHTLRTRLDLLTPDLDGQVSKKQVKQREYHDCHSRQRELNVGQVVWVRSFRDGPRWKKAVVCD